MAGACECGNEPYGFRKMRRISCSAEDVLVSKEEFFGVQ